MSADFVPFLQSLNAKLNASAQNPEFAPLPQAGGGGAVSAGAAHAHVTPGEVKVELKREGDRVSQIRIQCRCGEVIELLCDYGAGETRVA